MRPPSQKERGVPQSAVCVCCPGSRSLPKTISLIPESCGIQECKPSQPPRPGDHGASPAWLLQKPGHQPHVKLSSRRHWSVAKGEHEDDAHPLRSLKGLQSALRCLFNWKPVCQPMVMMNS